MERNIVWTDKLKVGIKEIDKQHKIFYKFVNHLLDECLASREIDPDNTRKRISKIRTFAVKHFHSEESLMSEFNYPYFKEHREKHRDILDRLMEYKIRAEYRELDRDSTLKFAYFLIEWFSNQTLNDDLKLANYLTKEVGFGRKLIIKLHEFF
ncbi:MAG: bacteriohemerythrin [Victivallales bacterium]|nr:bacteriohemerythrin [Victivallales bacterium]MCF7888558.1 bacteriohemerythrin [Victivallales bacterium]